MGRQSRGAHGTKLDWSKHERAWADLLHKEIFETGRYFRKTELNQFKSKPKNFIRKKNRESPEEDEGFEVISKIIRKLQWTGLFGETAVARRRSIFVKFKEVQICICSLGWNEQLSLR